MFPPELADANNNANPQTNAECHDPIPYDTKV
jgi:hypothetical protein